MVVFMLSPDDSLDQLYISNYACCRSATSSCALDGIGDITIFGARDYSMRLWLDPDKIANLGMTASDVVAAIRAQNLQIAGGQLGEPPIADRALSAEPDLYRTVEGPIAVREASSSSRARTVASCGCATSRGSSSVRLTTPPAASIAEDRGRDAGDPASRIERARHRKGHQGHHGRAEDKFSRRGSTTTSATTRPSSSANRSAS